MSDEYGAAGAGAAGGAVAGGAAGTMVMPGIGTAIGAGVGALAGGASGYLGGRGAAKRRKAQEEARARYLAALQLYQQQELQSSQQRQDLLTKQAGQASNQFSTYMGQKPGDQTEALKHDAEQQSSALYAAQAPTPALAGPLAGQYQSEMQGRIDTEVKPMALDYSADRQNFAGDAALRDYTLAGTDLQRERDQFEQSRGLRSAQDRVALAKAEAAFGVERQKAQQAGSEQMMYGALLNSGLGLANQFGMAKARSNAYNKGYGDRAPSALDNPALSQTDYDSWNSRVQPAMRPA